MARRETALISLVPSLALSVAVAGWHVSDMVLGRFVPRASRLWARLTKAAKLELFLRRENEYILARACP